ncbi:amidohydrolase family protein [Paenibacillus sp. J5C_2022]|uniref:amidohydrolase family protein n=1 Tax=Paenibacillus sp. J5C2022 TaxID=2977129 RepID=UPI0021CE86AE|nr:amidohydrolase family protein [Paenibacillus sp. J5C2022]MCU6709596.1 amidohydrolase family protein [Paenibacillus sp. J5C2022]
MRIDTHIHLYDPSAGNFEWPTPDTPLYRKVTPADFVRTAASAGITQAVVVACTTQPEQTELILQTMHDDPAVAAIIGFIDADSADFKAYYDEFCRYSKFRGFRFLCDKEPTAQTKSNAAYVAGKPANVLEFLGEFTGIAKYRGLVEDNPEVTFIIEHFARMQTDARTLTREYRQFVDDMAACGNVYMKLSALIPLAGAAKAPTDAECYETLLETVFHAFGEDRCLFGSDWPLLELKGNYGDAVEITETFLRAQSHAALEKVMHLNALDVYRVQRRGANE